MPSTPYPLGRRVEHDARSYAFALPVLPKSAIKSVQWTRRVPIFDQGSLGSCTGNAAAGVLGTDSMGRTGATTVRIVNESVVRPVDEDLAVRIYSKATQVDEFAGEYPPDDTGSSGLGAAKALQSFKLISAYNHAFSLAALDAALQTGPVMWGTVWLNSMFDPAPGGRLVVNPSSGEAGGHELVINGLDVTTGVYFGHNSWGTGWGDQGHFYTVASDLQWLLSQDGDITQPVYAAPAPSDQAVHNAFKSYARTEAAWAKGKGLT